MLYPSAQKLDNYFEFSSKDVGMLNVLEIFVLLANVREIFDDLVATAEEGQRRGLVADVEIAHREHRPGLRKRFSGSCRA